MKESNKKTGKTNNQLQESVPISVLGNGMRYVSVEVNGKQLNLLLDTGSIDNSFDERCFDELSAIIPLDKESLHNKFWGTGSRKYKTTYKTRMNLKMGNKQCDTSFYIFKATSYDFVKKSYGVTLHGSLGHEFFVKNNAVIDFSKSALLFNSLSEQENDIDEELIELGSIYGMKKGVAAANVKYKNRQLHLHLDTCISENELEESVFAQIRDMEKTKKTKANKTLTEIENPDSKVNSQTEGKIKMGKCSFDVMFQLKRIDLFEFVYFFTGVDLHGTMGSDFLCRHELILDYSKGKIYMHKPSQETPTEELQ